MYLRTAFINKKDLGFYLSELLDLYLKGEIEEQKIKENLNQNKEMIYKDGEIDNTLIKHYLYKRKSLLIEKFIEK